MKIKLLILGIFFLQFVHGQETFKLKHCNCEDIIDQSKPTLNGEFKRICNGKTVEQGKFVNGEKDGLWESWSKKGHLIRSINYSKGQLHGSVKFFYPNGKKKLEGTFEKNLKVGTWTFFNDGGKVIKTGNYENGRPVGTWKVFNWKGQKELYVYDFSQNKYLKRGSKDTFFEPAAVMQNDNTEEWYLLFYPKRIDTSSLTPVEGYILSNDIYCNLMEVPLEIWDTYLQHDFNLSITIKSGEIHSVYIDSVSETKANTPMLTFLINTNEKKKLKEVEHTELSLKLLEFKILEVFRMMGPWIGNDNDIIIQMAYVVNKFKNSPF